MAVVGLMDDLRRAGAECRGRGREHRYRVPLQPAPTFELCSFLRSDSPAAMPLVCVLFPPPSPFPQPAWTA